MNYKNLPYYPQFHSAVERLFNSWTALQLAVEHGMGGSNGRKMALQLIEYITEYCCVTDNMDASELMHVLDDIMDEEFETLCEDNSTIELANLLVKYIGMCRMNMVEQMMLEVSRLPPCQLWLCKPQIINAAPIQPNEVIHDIDEEGEEDENKPEPMEEDAEPGWTVVRTRRKN